MKNKNAIGNKVSHKGAKEIGCHIWQVDAPVSITIERLPEAGLVSIRSRAAKLFPPLRRRSLTPALSLSY
jgi:hypothetical protein